MKRTGIPIGCLVGAAIVSAGCSKSNNSGGNDAGSQNTTPSATLGSHDCDPMVPEQCGFPFPSNVYLKDDPSSPTGKRVAFGNATLPQINNQNIDPSAWADSDGFSPGQAPTTYLAGATTTGLPTQDTIDASLQADCPTVLLDTSTNPPTRVPHFDELDVSSKSSTDQAFMIRPVVRLKDGTRYIVAIRNVKDSSGNAIPPSDVFKALRDGTPSQDDTVGLRKELYADIFSKLKDAGVDKSNLQIAWDFTTASKQNNTGQLISMRDQALAAIGPNGPSYKIVKSDDNPDDYTARRILGTVHVPLFLDHGNVTIDTDPLHPDVTTGYKMTRDASGKPVMNGYADFEFVVQIPKSVAMDTAPAPILLQGHGLFSDRTEGQDPNASDYNYLLKLANEKKYVTISLDLLGWRTPGDLSNFPPDTNQEDDHTKAAGFITQDVGAFRGMIDRGTQGMLNQLVAVRMMKTSFAKDPLVQYNGHSVIDTSTAYYRGDSQGGILGITFMALSQDVTRGYLGEPGMPYDLLLMRSKDFSEFLQGLNIGYGSAMNVQLVIGLMQMFWDRLEGNGFAPYITGTTLDSNTPSHNVIINDGVGDFQVTPLGAHILARAVGAKSVGTPIRSIWGIDNVAGPVMGNGIIEFDFGVESMSGVTVPTTDQPPTGPSSADPHDKIRIIDAVYDETDTFLRTGNSQNFCPTTKCDYSKQ